MSLVQSPFESVFFARISFAHNPNQVGCDILLHHIKYLNENEESNFI